MGRESRNDRFAIDSLRRKHFGQPALRGNAARVAWAQSTIDLEWNSNATQLSRIAEVLNNLG